MFIAASDAETKDKWLRQFEHFSRKGERLMKYPRFTEPSTVQRSVLRTITIEIISGNFARKEDYECEIGFTEGDPFVIPLAKTNVSSHTLNPTWNKQKFEFRRVLFLFLLLLLTVYLMVSFWLATFSTGSRS